MAARTPQQVRLDAEILAVVKQIADEQDEGNVSLVIRRALRASPVIKARIEARRQAAPAGVGNVA